MHGFRHRVVFLLMFISEKQVSVHPNKIMVNRRETADSQSADNNWRAVDNCQLPTNRLDPRSILEATKLGKRFTTRFVLWHGTAFSTMRWLPVESWVKRTCTVISAAEESCRTATNPGSDCTIGFVVRYINLLKGFDHSESYLNENLVRTVCDVWRCWWKMSAAIKRYMNSRSGYDVMYITI